MNALSRSLFALVIATLLAAAPAAAGPWRIGGGGGFQANAYNDHEDFIRFSPGGTMCVFAERQLVPLLAARLVGGYSMYAGNNLSLVQETGGPLYTGGPSHEEVSLGIATFGAILRLHPHTGERGAPYVEAGPALCWSRWRERVTGGIPNLGERTTRASTMLPGLAWGAGVELHPGSRVRMDIGVAGLLTTAPGLVGLPMLSYAMPGLRQVGIAANVGVRI